MAALLTDRTYTVEEFLALPDDEPYELVDGHIVEAGTMGAIAARVGSRLNRRLEAHAETAGLGHVFDSSVRYVLPLPAGTRVRKPDMSFVARGRFPHEQVPRGDLKLAPDLAVEVVSPKDDACELQVKIEEYLRVGVGSVWAVYPTARVVLAYAADGSVRRLRPADMLTDPVLPGLAVPVADLFAGLGPEGEP